MQNNPPGSENPRRHPRFVLHCPTRIKFGERSAIRELEAQSRNISIGGVLVETSEAVPANCSVEFVIGIQGAKQTKLIQVKGSGRVVRVEKYSSGTFGVAIQCTRPISRPQWAANK